MKGKLKGKLERGILGVMSGVDAPVLFGSFYSFNHVIVVVSIH